MQAIFSKDIVILNRHCQKKPSGAKYISCETGGMFRTLGNKHEISQPLSSSNFGLKSVHNIEVSAITKHRSSVIAILSSVKTELLV